MSVFPTLQMNNGVTIPSLGIGCWMGHVGKEDDTDAEEMVLNALKLGYRHIDAAFNYGNEKQVGRAIAKSGVDREQLFITTKLASTHHACVKEAVKQSIQNLGCNYIDLYLMHWPQAMVTQDDVLQPDEYPTIVDTWKEMEKLLDTGKVRSIGVSNFSIKTLRQLLPHAKIIPVVNQVEMHPMLPQLDLLEYCRSKSIILTAYTPLGKHRAELVSHPLLVQIKDAHGCTSAQVLLSWLVKKGVIVIPKSTKLERMKENMTLIDLTQEESRALDQIHESKGMHRSVCGFHSKGGMAFGWTYEQLGWPMHEGGVVW